MFEALNYEGVSSVIKLKPLKRLQITKLALPTFIVSGLLCLALVASLQLSWGTAYGQTTGGGLVLTKTVSANTILPGQTVTFTITLTNNTGTTTFGNVIITDNIPGQFDLISATTSKGTLRITGQRVRVELDSFAPGESVQIVIVTRAKRGAGNGPVTNRVRLDATDPIGNAVVREASADVMLEEAGEGGGEPPVTNPVIPGLPNTGSETLATQSNEAIPVWKLVGLGALLAIMLMSGALLVVESSGKKTGKKRE